MKNAIAEVNVIIRDWKTIMLAEASLPKLEKF